MVKALKIIGYVILLVLVAVGVFCYLPLILPIVIIFGFSRRGKTKEPPPEDDEVLTYEILDD